MRIFFPTSIPMGRLLAFLSAVLVIQLVEGTDPLFALLMVAAQLAAALAFNRLGGMTHMSGAFCLFTILPNVTVPELTHLVLGQPGDFNLEHPITTAGACALFFLSIMSAAFMVSLTKHGQPYLDRISFTILELRIISAIACVFAVGIQFVFLTHNGPIEDGSTLAALNHFYGHLLATSVMLAAYARLAVTNGRSAMSWYVGSLLVIGVVPGILSASKEGMLTPVFCWLVVVAASGHRFSRLGAVILFGFAFLIWGFVYPFSQNARFPVREAETFSDKTDLIIEYIKDPSQFPNWTASFEESSEFGTDTSKVNIIQRYSQLKSIDMLITADLRTGYTSIDRYTPVFLSMVPHAFWPDRPDFISTNELGHKAGFKVDENDTSTGLAIGSPGFFFDLGGWLALAVYTISCFTLFFYVTIRLIGKTTSGVWALIPIGTEALIAGAASPAAIFLLVTQFLGTLFVLVVVLKMVSYLSQILISRPISARA